MSVCLKAGRYRQPHGQVSIMVLVVGEHRVNFLPHEEGRFTMRELFGGLGERRTNSSNPFQMVFARVLNISHQGMFQVWPPDGQERYGVNITRVWDNPSIGP